MTSLDLLDGAEHHNAPGLIRRRADGRSVLIISHFVADEHRFDRIVKLCDGRLCEGQYRGQGVPSDNRSP